MFCKMADLKILQNSQENICAGVSFVIAGLTLETLLKETPKQVFSCKLCQICKKNIFTKHFQTTASVLTAACFSVLANFT